VARRRCECGRPAAYRVRGGKLHTGKDHDLCGRCWQKVYAASRKPPAKDRGWQDVVTLPVHGEDLAPQRMHLQIDGCKPACGESRATAVLPDGGKLFGTMTTWLQWVDCEACREAAGEAIR